MNGEIPEERTREALERQYDQALGRRSKRYLSLFAGATLLGVAVYVFLPADQLPAKIFGWAIGINYVLLTSVIVWALVGVEIRRTTGPRPLLVVGIIALPVLVLWVIYAALVSKFFAWPKEAGPFGDLFGGFSALFGALGFVAVLVGMWMQHRNLKEERASRTEIDERQEKQLGIMQDQLRMMTDHFKAIEASREEDVRRYRENCQPSFHFSKRGQIASDAMRWEITNTRGKVHYLQARLQSGKSLLLQEKDNVQKALELPSFLDLPLRDEDYSFTMNFVTEQGGLLSTLTYFTNGDREPTLLGVMDDRLQQ